LAVCEQLAQEQAIFGVGLSSDSKSSIKTKSWSPKFVYREPLSIYAKINFISFFLFSFWNAWLRFFSDNPQHILYVPNTIHCKVRSLPG